MAHDTLNDLLKNLELIEQEIESSDDLSDEQIKAHFDAVEAVDQKVDRLLGYMDQCKMYAQLHKERAERLKAQNKAWEQRYNKLEKYALWLLSAHPEVEWRGKNRTMSKRQSPGSLECPFKITKTFSNYLEDSAVEFIPEEYREREFIWVLKADKLKQDLKSGKTFVFAQLVKNDILSIKERT